MLDKLDNFHSYTMTKIRKLVGIYYEFYRRPDTLDYVAKLLEKDKFFYDDIKNVSK